MFPIYADVCLLFTVQLCSFLHFRRSIQFSLAFSSPAFSTLVIYGAAFSSLAFSILAFLVAPLHKYFVVVFG